MNHKLMNELTVWNNGDLSQAGPTQYEDPDRLLADARRFELGDYEGSEEVARERSLKAIKRYCESKTAMKYEDQ